ncbi:MAG: hypothetical protein HQK87_05055 [Nitrospinae bacterium]|nr:hypothetical protein [Nitrospinota bacterium]
MSVGAVAGNSNVMQVKSLMSFTNAAMKAVQSSVAKAQQVGAAIAGESPFHVTA